MISLRFLALLPLLLLMLSSCKKDDNKPLSGNEITLSSKKLGSQVFYTLGYSFEKSQFFQRMGSNTDIDIYLTELLTPAGSLAGVQFSTNSVSETVYGFFLNGEFSDQESAENYYNSYVTAVEPDEYLTLTDTVKQFQVYTFKTWKSNYVKFIVRDIRKYTGFAPSDYIEVDIRYFIQRDGSDKLSE